MFCLGIRTYFLSDVFYCVGAYHVKILFCVFSFRLFSCFNVNCYGGGIMNQLLYGTTTLSGYTRIPRDVWVRLGAQGNKELKVTGRNANIKYWSRNK